MTRDERLRKNCELCKKLRDPDSFMAAVHVKIDLGECETCEVTLSQPSADNEIILEAYELLPRNYDGFTGRKLIRLSEVKEVFAMLGISPSRFDDCYIRLMHFHGELISNLEKKTPKNPPPKGSSGFDQDSADRG